MTLRVPPNLELFRAADGRAGTQANAIQTIDPMTATTLAAAYAIAPGVVELRRDVVPACTGGVSAVV